jgi:hypothetical protein
MLTRQDLENLGEEIFNLLQSKGIPVEMFVLGVKISEDDYIRLKDVFGETSDIYGKAFSAVTKQWAVNITYPFLKLKP